MPNVFVERPLPHQQPEGNAFSGIRESSLAAMRHGAVKNQGGAPARHRRAGFQTAGPKGTPKRHTPMRGEASQPAIVSKEAPERNPAPIPPMTPQHAVVRTALGY